VRAGTNLPVIVGSGLAPEQIPALLGSADGAIIGRRLMQAVAEVRAA
jgi:predicted TIM-barrel enzyme